MINWNAIKGLLVVSKLEEVLNKWFGVEQVYADPHAKIRSSHLEPGYQYKNQFMKVQMHMDYGYEYLGSDLEKITEMVSSAAGKPILFDSYFPHVKGLAAPIHCDGEFLGTVLAYPFIMDTTDKVELEALTKKMVDSGATLEDVQVAISRMKKMTEKDLDYLKDLVGLMSDEISTFHAEISKREARIHELNSEVGSKYRYHSMIGKSKGMQKIYSVLEKISGSDSSVLIQGENGTGKELVAKAVHFTSPRKDCTFLAVNCSAFNDNLLDSELFGHVKGAFTGAVKDKKGLFESADSGTLFLDEIGDTSLSMQVKLLRVLQEGTFLPVGATGPRKADVRIICATNKDLKTMMAKGEFREDLYYRINVINVNLPPLRERAEDVPLLMDHFLAKRCGESGVPLKTISKKCLEKMLDYPWPGNVRELENEIERLVVLAGQDKMITPDLLSARIQEYGDDHSIAASSGVKTSGTLKDALEELEALMIKEGLKRCNFNKSKLAKELDISRASLIMKVEKYALDKRKVVGE